MVGSLDAAVQVVYSMFCELKIWMLCASMSDPLKGFVCHSRLAHLVLPLF